jgi:hypothetical protein
VEGEERREKSRVFGYLLVLKRREREVSRSNSMTTSKFFGGEALVIPRCRRLLRGKRGRRSRAILKSREEREGG